MAEAQRFSWFGAMRRALRHAGCACVLVLSVMAGRGAAEDVSSPAILQWFQAGYDVMEDRSADMFLAGYGAVWMPPPGRADVSQTGSVGYDVYDRFDLGKPRYETAYGTETGLKQYADVLHRFDARLHIDAVLNHNGYSENDYNGQQYIDFRQAGGYPGFVLENPDGGTDPAGVPGTYGDFHNPALGGILNGQLAGLLDIDHSKNYQLIRQPVAAGNPQNIPAGVTPWAGRLANVPDAANARFYQDRDLPSETYYDPVLNQNFTMYPFNTADPLQGDAVAENATGLLMRYLQWMVQEVGVDGFRLDAAKHMEHWALQYMDAAVYRSNPRLLLDGSVDHVFMYGEVVPGDGKAPGQSDHDYLDSFVRKDINPNSPNTIGGNRDVLDFMLRGSLNDNLRNSAVDNDWRNVVNASMDVYDDGLHNGSQGVLFVSNHDGGGADMNNVAHAYILTQPGEAIVYHNAHQFGGFPEDGRGDALGNYGDTITELVEIRTTHGRGDYRERWLEKDYFAMERSGSMLVMLDNRNDAGVSELKTMNTDFAAGTRLVELTGNAAAYNATNPVQPLAEVLTVNGLQQVSARFLHNDEEDKGYLIYGLQTPQSAAGLVVTNASGVLPGAPIDSGNEFLNGQRRLADLQVVAADQINIRLDTQAVTLPDGFRDVNADGDNALLRVNNGMDTNGNGEIDYRTPGSVVYGFEEFSPGNKNPGYGSPTGDGWYQESIDATSLPEGYNFLTVRAFRKGVGGPAVFKDFKQVVYLDRLPPESVLVSFDPYASAPNDPNNRDFIVRSVDKTADSVHVLLDLGANLTDAQILAQVNGGNQAGYYDRDMFVRGTAVGYGNHAATIVTFEPTGNYSIQRFAGLFTQTNLRGVGFGDMNFGNSYTLADIRETTPDNGSVEDVLFSQNGKFSAAFDVNGDGLGDNRDLFLLEDVLVAAPTSAFVNATNEQNVLNAYTDLLLKRGDVDSSGVTNAADVAALYNSFGATSWTMDLNVDGVVDITDVSTMITQLFRTVPGDFTLDGVVDATDYLAMRKWSGTTGAMFTQGDADLDGDVDEMDLSLWQRNYGFARQALSPVAGSGGGAAPVPEPSALWLCLLFSLTGIFRRSGRRSTCK